MDARRSGLVRIDLELLRPSCEQRVVLLLQAVLTLAVVVDESEELGRQGRARRSACLRVDADRGWLQRHRAQGAVGLGIGDLLAQVRIHVGRQNDVVAGARHCLAEGDFDVAAQFQEVDEGRGVALALGVADAVQVGDDAVAVDRLSKNDGAGPVVDGAAPGWHGLMGHLGLVGESRQLLALVDLPIGQTHGHAAGQQDQRHEQEQKTSLGVCPAKHGDACGLSGPG